MQRRGQEPQPGLSPPRALLCPLGLCSLSPAGTATPALGSSELGWYRGHVPRRVWGEQGLGTRPRPPPELWRPAVPAQGWQQGAGAAPCPLHWVTVSPVSWQRWGRGVAPPPRACGDAAVPSRASLDLWGVQSGQDMLWASLGLGDSSGGRWSLLPAGSLLPPPSQAGGSRCAGTEGHCG